MHDRRQQHHWSLLIPALALLAFTSLAVRSVAGNPQEPASRVTIGVVDGDPHQLFGRIRDVAVNAAGDVFILDEMAMNVRWFDRHGVFRGVAGRPGGGPGEFRAPMAVDVGEDGQVEVLDPSLSRISRFAPTDSGLVLTNELATPVRGFDFCRLNGDYYLLTYVHDGGGIVTVLDSSGTILRRFARPVGTIPRNLPQFAPAIREQNMFGHVLCTRRPQRIVILPINVDTIRAFDPQGQLVWSTAIAGFHHVRRVLTADGRLTFAPEDGTGMTSAGAFVSLLDSTTVLASMQVHVIRQGELQETYEWRRLRLADGREADGFQTSNLAFAGRWSGLTYEFTNADYPRVLIESKKQDR